MENEKPLTLKEAYRITVGMLGVVIWILAVAAATGLFFGMVVRCYKWVVE